MSPSLLTDLAPELKILVSKHLSGSDVKSLRLTCRSLAALIRPRLQRIFISSSPRDIAVFRAVADDENLRHGVREIIWDDARLPVKEFDEDHPSPCYLYYCLCQDQCTTDGDNAPPRYTKACKQNADHLWKRLQGEAHMPHNIEKARRIAREIPVSASWQCYRELAVEQKHAVEHKLDIEAMEYGLTRFTSLERITITPAAHGYLFTPLYETPMIRSIPFGMNYLIPRGWPTLLDDYGLSTPPWDETVERDCYRGFTNIVRLLALNTDIEVKELVVTADQLPTGISCDMFVASNPSYEHLRQIVQRPGFRRLDLALHANTAWRSDWATLRNGRLYDLLADACSLESISLSTNVETNPDASSTEDGQGTAVHFIPLQSILPTQNWPKLTKMGIHRFLVCQSDIMSLLASLPTRTLAIELSCLYFLDDSGHYGTLLEQMREDLSWHNRPVAERPKLSISVETPSWSEWEIVINLDREVQEFLYDGGPNPFVMSGWAKGEPRLGVGVEVDILEPSHRKPYDALAER